MLEYANLRSGTALSDQRIANGTAEPHDDPDVVPGQRDGRAVAARPRHGRRTTRSSPRRPPGRCGRSTPTSSSSSAAAPVRRCPPSASGSASCSRRPTTTSTSSPATPTTSPATGDYGSFLASAVEHGPLHRLRRRDRRPRQGAQAAATRRSTSRSTSGTSGTSPAITTSTGSRRSTTWPVAPRLLEDVYSVVDAVVFGKPADLAAPPRRPRDGGEPGPARERDRADHDRARRPAWRQTTFFPFALTSRLARGVTLELKLDCPTYETALTAQCRSWMPSPRTTPTAEQTRSSWSTAARRRGDARDRRPSPRAM